MQVWNPCFDVTPASLIEGIITEQGLVPKKNRAFDVAAFIQQQVKAGFGAKQYHVTTMLLLSIVQKFAPEQPIVVSVKNCNNGVSSCLFKRSVT